MGQCHVLTYSTTISPLIGSIKLDPIVPQAIGLKSTIVVAPHKYQDHLGLKDTIVPPTCQKSQLHLSLDQKQKKPSNGKKRFELRCCCSKKDSAKDNLKFPPWEEEEEEE
jgi:hypothetical protein